MTKVTLKSIDKAIGTLATNITKARNQAHEIGMMIVYHAAPKSLSDDCNGSGDCTRMLKLLEVLPTSWQAQYQEWLKAFTPIRVNVKAGNVGFDPAYKKLETQDEKDAVWDLESAASTPFFDFVKEPEAKYYSFEDFIKMVSRIPATIEKRIKNGEVLDKDLPSVERVMQTLSTIRFERVKSAENDDASGEETEESPLEAATA